MEGWRLVRKSSWALLRPPNNNSVGGRHISDYFLYILKANRTQFCIRQRSLGSTRAGHALKQEILQVTHSRMIVVQKGRFSIPFAAQSQASS